MATLDDVFSALTLCAALGCGLMAGVFFAFSAFIMKALTRLPPRDGIAAMQSMNVAVLNPWFLGACPRNNLSGFSGHRCHTEDVRR
jgi:uncharacterized membrane protein